MPQLPNAHVPMMVTLLAGASYGWHPDDQQMVRDNKDTPIECHLDEISFYWDVPAVANDWERVGQRLEKINSPLDDRPGWEVHWHLPVPAHPNWYGNIVFYEKMPTEKQLQKILARIVKAVRWNWKG
jgi:hypothetical protein